MLDREAMRCTKKTPIHYQHTVGHFVTWVEERGIRFPDGITPHLIREYPVELQARRLMDTTQHARASRPG